MVYSDRHMARSGTLRLLLALTIVVAAVTLAVVISRRLPDAGKPNAAKPIAGNEADLSIKGFQFTETVGGVDKWTLLAESGEYDTSHSVAELKKVRLTVAPMDRSLGELTLIASAATYNVVAKDLLLRGGVTATSTTGMRFKTSTARFQADPGIVTTADPVSFFSRSINVDGTGMEYHVDTGGLKIKSRVTALIFGRPSP